MKRVVRFIKSMWRYILHGKKVSFDVYSKRLNACNNCMLLNREKWTCGVCGCPVTKKATMSTEDCSDKKW